MTVDIPEEAVAKGAERLWLFRTPIAKTRESCTEQAREVIAAALPYLAPAGDGGLREALARQASAWEAMRINPEQEYPTSQRIYDNGVEEGYSLAAEDLRSLLAAPPAAPAVPQPVDREALHDQISAAVTKAVAEYRGYLAFDGLGSVAAAAALAVLAGEQERVQ